VKKILSLCLFFFVTMLMVGNVIEVNASAQTEIFYNMTSGNMEETDEYGTSTYGRYKWTIFDMDEDEENGCYYTPSTYIKIRQRSVAGATGYTDYVYPPFVNKTATHYHSTYYGDEDIYLEVTLYNINGVCDLTLIFDPDY